MNEKLGDARVTGSPIMVDKWFLRRCYLRGRKGERAVAVFAHWSHCG